MAVNDRFAAIAATEINTKDKNLVVPHTRKCVGKFLPLNAVKTEDPVFTVEEKSQYDDLQEKIRELRQHYQPFMQHLAPDMPILRKRMDLKTFQWRIATDADQSDFFGVLSGEGAWDIVTIPHYGGPLGKAETFYRTEFTIEQLPKANEAVFLHFCAVDYTATVYLNGKVLGSHEGFFAPFEFECTKNLRKGSNTLVVCVGNDFVHVGNALKFNGEEFTGDKIYAATGPGFDDPEVGWHHCPPGMGIYQAVYLETRARQFISDAYVRPLPEEGIAELHLETYSCDVGKRFATYLISVYGKNHKDTVIENFEFRPKAEKSALNGVFEQALAVFTETDQPELSENEQVLKVEKGFNYFTLPIPMGNFRWWELEQPWLYEVQIQVLDKDRQVIDTAKTTFGMRSFRMDTESDVKGMLYLNGKKCRLRGANTMGFEQQDVMRGDFDQLIEDILMAKACNMNFLRITQRPVQDEIYDYMDMLGLMAQTDLPLFGALRRNKLIESVRQAAEMEKLIRKHPCCVIVSYINEPAPDLKGTPHLFASCEELSTFFEMADNVIHMENPDRVTKHVDGDYDPPRTTLQDNHCYTCWYNGFGVDAGALHKGDWLPVPENWYYACGEFGAEGLEDEAFMRKHYPKEWLPQTKEEENTWNAESIIGCQSGGQHMMFYETPHSLREWADWSQDYQAEATKWMTEAFRRDERMVSFALHLFIDAFPSGWLKSVVDCERKPKPAFYAYQNAITPTMISMRTDRFQYFVGENASVEFWLCNDRAEAQEHLQLVYEALTPSGAIRSGTVTCGVGESTVCYLGEAVFPLGDCSGDVIVKCALLNQNGEVMHCNSVKLQIREKEVLSAPLNVYVPEMDSITNALAKEMGANLVDLKQAECVLIHNYEIYLSQKEVLDRFVENGGRLIFVELPAGHYELVDINVDVKATFMSPRHFVSKDTGHAWVKGFDRKAFKHWYEEKEDRITPILDLTFTAEDMKPVLLSGNTDKNGQWQKVFAVGEKHYGKGVVILSQLKLVGRVKCNPTAWNFAKRMFCE